MFNGSVAGHSPESTAFTIYNTKFAIYNTIQSVSAIFYCIDYFYMKNVSD